MENRKSSETEVSVVGSDGIVEKVEEEGNYEKRPADDKSCEENEEESTMEMTTEGGT